MLSFVKKNFTFSFALTVPIYELLSGCKIVLFVFILRGIMRAYTDQIEMIGFWSHREDKLKTVTIKK